MSPIKRPSYLRIDALKELGNIGSGHAITGLSKLLKKRIDVNVTNVDLIPVKIIYNFFNGPESMVSVVYLEGYSERFRGMMFLIFPYPESLRLVELATGRRPKDEKVWDEYSAPSWIRCSWTSAWNPTTRSSSRPRSRSARTSARVFSSLFRPRIRSRQFLKPSASTDTKGVHQ